jgi:hypothetical protein
MVAYSRKCPRKMTGVSSNARSLWRCQNHLSGHVSSVHLHLVEQEPISTGSLLLVNDKVVKIRLKKENER